MLASKVRDLKKIKCNRKYNKFIESRGSHFLNHLYLESCLALVEIMTSSLWEGSFAASSEAIELIYYKNKLCQGSSFIARASTTLGLQLL